MTTNDPDPIRAARDEFLEPGVSPADSAPVGERPGDVIDRYKLLQPIGEGGMGTVWMAEQHQPVKRQVALKIIKLGMDTKEVVVRFEAERQALALMDHPHIAKVFDGGATETGRPYFAMELVRGVPITDYCDSAMASLEDRLDLLGKVCDAVQHAHQKGVIHRDLKPSNVMVTLHDGVPVPKVIDFGIAKATSAELTQKTMFTRYAQLIGTPEYMAPEQAEMSGLGVDTRADVYSLGVLLYELLTGTKPFEMTKLLERGYEEMLRTIREENPAKPSTRISTMGEAATPIAAKRHINAQRLRQTLRGELDWIVMKALEKDRSRRYESASSLAADLQRFMRDEPVLAAPPSTAYRLRKLLVRRKKTVAVGAALTFLLVAGSAGTLIGWLDAKRANDELEITIEEKEEQRKAAVHNAELARAAEAKASENASLARAAEAAAEKRAQDVQRMSTFQAEQLLTIDPYEMGRAMREFLIESVPMAQRDGLETSLAPVDFTDFARSALETGIFEHTIDATLNRFADQPGMQADVLYSLAATTRRLGLQELALRAVELEHPLRQQLLGDDDPATIRSVWLAGAICREMSRYDEAEKLLRQARASFREILGDDHFDTITATNSLAVLLETIAPNSAECLELHNEAFDAFVRTLGESHRMTLETQLNLGVALERQGQAEVGRQHILTAYEGLEELLGPNDLETLTAGFTLAASHATQGDYAAAEALLRDNLRRRQELFGKHHVETVSTMTSLADMLMRQGQLEEAATLAEESFRISSTTLGEDTMITMGAARVMAGIAHRRGDWENAAEFGSRYLGFCEANWGDSHPESLVARHNYAAALIQLGDLDEAEVILEDLIVDAGAALGEDDLRTIQAIETMGSLHIHRRAPEKAEGYFATALNGMTRLFGEDHPHTHRVIIKLNSARNQQTNARTQERTTRERYNAAVERFGDGDIRVAMAALALGNALRTLDRNEEAKQILEPTLETIRGFMGDSHNATVATAAELGYCYSALNDLERANDLFQYAREQAVAAQGETSSFALKAQAALSTIDAFKGDAAACFAKLESVHQTWEATVGEDNPFTLYAANQLAGQRTAHREFEAATRIYERALAAARKSGNEDLCAMFEHHLVAPLTRIGREDEALTLARQATTYYRTSPKSSFHELLHSESMLRLALQANGHFEDARREFELAIEVQRAADPIQEKPLARILISYAQAALESGDEVWIRDAEAPAREAVEIRRRIYPEGHIHAWAQHHAATVLGSVLVRSIDPTDPETAIERLTEAEALLVPSAEWLVEDPKLAVFSENGQDFANQAADRAAGLFDAWHSVQPDRGHDAVAAEWRARVKR